MAGVDYCTVLPSWDFTKDPACVVNYLFDSIDGPADENGGNGEQQAININITDQNLVLERTTVDDNGEEDRESCSLSITCKPQYRVSVLGMDIVSESRAVEVYDTSEGYLSTTRGSQIPDGEGGEYCNDIYRCKIRLRETMYGFSVKFPCTVNMQRFIIHHVMLILNPETDDMDDVSDSGSFNLDKVKSFIDTENMSTGAQELLKTMEIYQQNKRAALSGLQGAVGGAVPSGPGIGGLGLMGLMSMFSGIADSTSRATPNLSGTSEIPTTNFNHPCTTISDNSQSNDLSAGEQGNSEAGGDSSMFRILQNICGKVSKLRTTDQEETTLDHQETLLADDISLHEDDVEDRKVVDEQTVENLVNTGLQGVEDRLRMHVDNRLTAMEDRINTRLDQILALLKKTSDSESGETP